MDIYYDLAAAGFLILIFMNYRRQQRLDISPNRIFFVWIILTFITVCLEISAALLQGMAGARWLGWLLNILFLLAQQTMFLVQANYVLAWSRNTHRINQRIMLFGALYLIGGVLILTTPLTRWVFSIDAHGVFHWGKLSWIIYLILLYYLAAPLPSIWYRSKWFSRRKVYWIVSGSCLLIVAVLLQMFQDLQVTFLYAVVSIVLLLYFLFVQEPGYYQDETTGFIKMHGFEEVLKEYLAYGKPCYVLIMRIRNFTAMTEAYDYTKLSVIQESIAGIMRKLNGQMPFYHIAASSFAAITESQEEAEQLYHSLKATVPGTWNVDDEEIVHEYSYYLLNAGNTAVGSKELQQKINYARSDHQDHHRPGELISLSGKSVELEREKQEVAELIEEAILDNSIEIYFQPVYSLKRERITSMEVLARLRDKEKNFVNPEFFIRVAEENRTIIQLGEQIYRKACLFASQNHLFEKRIESMNINISPFQCCYEGLVDDFVRIAGEYQIPVSKIHLEITESALNNRGEIQTTLERLSRAGFKIALDDFGTGYSNLTSISMLPIQYVKIDKSLVWSYSEGKNQFLNELVPMIHDEGKQIIAEGIETEEHIEMFRRWKGEFLQGYYFSKPLSGIEFLRYLQNTLPAHR